MMNNISLQQFVMQFAYGFPSLVAYGIALYLGFVLRGRSPKASNIVILTMMGLMALFMCSAVVRGIIPMFHDVLGEHVMSAYLIWSLIVSTLEGAGLIALVAACFKVEPASPLNDDFQ